MAHGGLTTGHRVDSRDFRFGVALADGLREIVSGGGAVRQHASPQTNVRFRTKPLFVPLPIFQLPLHNLVTITGGVFKLLPVQDGDASPRVRDQPRFLQCAGSDGNT